MLNRKGARSKDVITIVAHQEIDITIEMQLAGSSAECSSDENSSIDLPYVIDLSDSSTDVSSELNTDDLSSDDDSEIEVKDALYSDKMTVGELKAGHERLESFLEKTSKNQPISFVELYQVFDDGAKFTDFRLSAKKGTAELVGSDMAAQAFNHSTPQLKKQFLDEALGDTLNKSGLIMLFNHGSAMRDIMDIRFHISKKIHDIGDVIEAKNKERYEAVAKMPAYSTVIAKRRAEVEAMLDAADSKKLELSAPQI